MAEADFGLSQRCAWKASRRSTLMFESRKWVGLCAGLALAGCIFDATGREAAGEEDSAATSEALRRQRLPELPDPSLAVPEGNRLAFSLDATGVQIYVCQDNGGVFSWVLQAPDATLYDARGHVVGKHYAGPTWEYRDKSTVAASRVAGFTPDPSAIPALLLQANAHAGKGRMASVTYIQRLETSGGLAPTSGCDTAHVGATTRVDYAATYYFYEARPAGCR
jgi:hypothetical protein